MKYKVKVVSRMREYYYHQERCTAGQKVFHFVQKHGMLLADIFIPHFKAVQLCTDG